MRLRFEVLEMKLVMKWIIITLVTQFYLISKAIEYVLVFETLFNETY